MADVAVSLTDLRNVGVSSAEAIARARSREWTRRGPSGYTPGADFRVIVANTYRLAAELSENPPLVLDGGNTEQIYPYPGNTVTAEILPFLTRCTMYFNPREATYPTPGHASLAAGMLQTLQLLANDAARANPSLVPADGAALTVQNVKQDAGIWPIAAIVTIVAIGAVAAVGWAYALIKDADNVTDRKLARDTNANLALQSHADLMALAAAHTEAERAMGKTMPLNAAEQAALDAINKTHSAALSALASVKPADPPVPSKPPIQAFAESAGTGLGLLLAAWVFFSSDK